MGLDNFREKAAAVWKAGVESVIPDALVENLLKMTVFEDGSAELTIRDRSFPLSKSGRLVVVGMGKASGKMASGAESALAPLVQLGRVSGIVNVPADAVIPLKSILLHPGRPAGLNEPTEAGAAGCRKMIGLIESASSDDIILALVSGGGSALAPLPVPEITLEEKARVTRYLSGGGANIEELNCVRKQLSQIKGGGMRRLCRGKRLVTLILSDVLGDPLDVIACGATVENRTSASDALGVLQKFGLDEREDLKNITVFLRKKRDCPDLAAELGSGYRDHINLIIANNQSAVEAAVRKAEQLHFSATGHGAVSSEGDVSAVAAELLRIFKKTEQPRAYISGGEPTVKLAAPSIRGKGGRNTQLALLLLTAALKDRSLFPRRFAFLSGGTDGEDGPTDAAGAFFDDTLLAEYRKKGEEGIRAAEEALRRNDSYTFFKENGGLFQTGRTGTNVCDLRVLLWE